jgi:hypothetical protein
MRIVLVALALTMAYSTFAQAKEAAPLAAVQKDDIRLLGRLNANTATREELLLLIDAQKADQLLEARSRGPLTSLAVFQLPAEASARLTLSGPSTLRRIRALPLEIYAPSTASATR